MNARVPDMGEVARRYGLTCIEDLTHHGSTSSLVAHVRDAGGAEYLLKRLSPPFHGKTVAALRTWEASGATPRVIEELTPDLYLLEWLPGRSLAEVPLGEPVPCTDIGRALAALHRTVPPADTPDIRSALLLEGWERLPPTMYALACRLAETLRANEPHAPALLHADLVPANVILTPGGPRFIDPIGRAGLPAWDLAQLAASAVGRDRRSLLGPLLDGYGEAPPLLAEAFAWMLLSYLQKNLAFPDSPFTPNLLPIAAALSEAPDVRWFLHNFLGSE